MKRVDVSGKVRGAFVRRGKGRRSGLLAAPLALDGPPEELLDVPRHVHGVVQVEVSLRVQYRVTPATGQKPNKQKSERSRWTLSLVFTIIAIVLSWGRRRRQFYPQFHIFVSMV